MKKKCDVPGCEKEFECSSDSQGEYLLKVHKLTQHKDFKEIKEAKKE